MASVTWALANVDFDVDDGFCHTAHWTVTRVDGDYSASNYGTFPDYRISTTLCHVWNY